MILRITRATREDGETQLETRGDPPSRGGSAIFLSPARRPKRPSPAPRTGARVPRVRRARRRLARPAKLDTTLRRGRAGARVEPRKERTGLDPR